MTIESTDAKLILNTENPWNHEKICRKVIWQSTTVYMYKEKKRKFSTILNYQNYEDCSGIDEDSTIVIQIMVFIQIECKNHFISLRQQLKFLENEVSHLQETMISYKVKSEVISTDNLNLKRLPNT